jgi:hypothetical protein
MLFAGLLVPAAGLLPSTATVPESANVGRSFSERTSEGGYFQTMVSGGTFDYYPRFDRSGERNVAGWKWKRLWLRE